MAIYPYIAKISDLVLRFHARVLGAVGQINDVIPVFDV